MLDTPERLCGVRESLVNGGRRGIDEDFVPHDLCAFDVVGGFVGDARWVVPHAVPALVALVRRDVAHCHFCLGKDDHIVKSVLTARQALVVILVSRIDEGVCFLVLFVSWIDVKQCFVMILVSWMDVGACFVVSLVSWIDVGVCFVELFVSQVGVTDGSELFLCL